jgi:hypothetical protein
MKAKLWKENGTWWLNMTHNSPPISGSYEYLRGVLSFWIKVESDIRFTLENNGGVHAQL